MRNAKGVIGVLLRGLPVLIELGLLIYCLIDCIQAPEISVRNLPKWAWLLLILLFPIVGPIAWLVAGRPSHVDRRREPVTGYPEYQRERPAPRGPDDDPAYLRELGRMNSDHEQLLEQWEADLRRREEDLRRRDDDTPG